jgi:hypothetical protein
VELGWSWLDSSEEGPALFLCREFQVSAAILSFVTSSTWCCSAPELISTDCTHELDDGDADSPSAMTPSGLRTTTLRCILRLHTTILRRHVSEDGIKRVRGHEKTKTRY